LGFLKTSFDTSSERIIEKLLHLLNQEEAPKSFWLLKNRFFGGKEKVRWWKKRALFF
jgi:hypothetical protein